MGKVFLTRLVPYGNYYRASAVELVGSGYNKNWKVQAWAICGDPQLNPVVVSAATTAADTPIVDAYAGCQDLGKVALGPVRQ